MNATNKNTKAEKTTAEVRLEEENSLRTKEPMPDWLTTESRMTLADWADDLCGEVSNFITEYVSDGDIADPVFELTEDNAAEITGYVIAEFRKRVGKFLMKEVR